MIAVSKLLTNSDAVLQAMAPDGKVTLSGFPWVPSGESRVLSPESLKSKILCERQNVGLHPLDAAGSQFCQALMGMPKRLRDGLGEHAVLLNGHDVERWFLKVVCGVGVAVKTAGLAGWNPPKEWLEILFGRRELEPPCGLYMEVPIGVTSHATSSLSVQTVFRESDDSFAGCAICVGGVRFMLAMAKWVKAGAGVYRPNELVFRQGSRTEIIALGWDEFVDNRSVEVRWSPGAAG